MAGISNSNLKIIAMHLARGAGLTGLRAQWAAASGLSAARSEALDQLRTDRSRENIKRVMQKYETAVISRIEDEAGWIAADKGGYGDPHQRRSERGAELDGLALGAMLIADGCTDDEIEDAGGLL